MTSLGELIKLKSILIGGRTYTGGIVYMMSAAYSVRSAQRFESKNLPLKIFLEGAISEYN